MNFKQFSALITLNGKLGWRVKKCRFSVSNASAPVHSTYAAMRASADFKPNVSYLAPNSKGVSESLSIFVAVFIKSINSLKASAIKLLRTSSIIKRVIRMGTTPINSAIFASSFSQFGSRIAPKANIYSLLSKISSKFFSPKFFSGFTNLVYDLLFAHSAVRRTNFRHQLADFFQMHFRFFDIGFNHFYHLYNKDSILIYECQADFYTGAAQ